MGGYKYRIGTHNGASSSNPESTQLLKVVENDDGATIGGEIFFLLVEFQSRRDINRHLCRSLVRHGRATKDGCWIISINGRRRA